MFVSQIPSSRILSSSTIFVFPLTSFASNASFKNPPFHSNLNLQSSHLGTSIQKSSTNTTSLIFKKRSPLMATVSLAPIEILVKSATGDPSRLGDCPFCHRVLLTLEEKKIPYESKLVDLSNKPDWFLELNPGGKVPVIKHDGKWIPDSDVIVQLLEKEHPNPSLEVSENLRTIGSAIFSSFVKFLKSKDPADGTEQTLIDELTKFDEHLKTHGPFINGKEISAVDLSLVPKLYHLRVALDHFKKWKVPGNLTHVLDYIKSTEARESFQKTCAPTEFVVKGWESHLA